VGIVRHYPGEEHYDFFPVEFEHEVTPGLVYRHRYPSGAFSLDLCLERLPESSEYGFHFRAEGGATLTLKREDIASWIRSGLEVGYAHGRAPQICAAAPIGPRLRPSALSRLALAGAQ